MQKSVNPFDVIFVSFDDSKQSEEKSNKYQLSGYDLRPSIFRIGKDILTLVIVFTLGLLASGVLFLISLLIRKSLIKLIFFKVFYFTLFAYPFRFLLEKMMKWTVSSGLQILDLANSID